jgi:hypothetical protein
MLATVILFLAAASAAQTPASLTTAKPTNCASPAIHQFDFWIGDWDVRGSKGELMGTNKVQPVVEGCAIHEAWAAQGEVGESFSIFDPTTGKWHQTWVDNKSHLWMIDGGMVNGSMVMTRTTAAQNDPTVTVLHRWTWTPSDRDHVRQLYETSRDGGKTWKVLFDGRYVRQKS